MQTKTPLQVLEDYRDTLLEGTEERQEFDRTIAWLSSHIEKEETDQKYLQSLYDSLAPVQVPENVLWDNGYHRSNDAALKELIESDWEGCLGLTDEELRSHVISIGRKEFAEKITALDTACARQADCIMPIFCLNMYAMTVQWAKNFEQVAISMNRDDKLLIEDGELTLYRTGCMATEQYILRCAKNAVVTSTLLELCKDQEQQHIKPESIKTRFLELTENLSETATGIFKS